MELPTDDKVIVEVLLQAYRLGAFPMADPDTGALNFYTSNPRGVFLLESDNPFHTPRSVRRAIRSRGFEIRADSDFENVIRACAAPRRDDDKSWIDERIIDWFSALHRAGHAHSVEAWRTDPETGEPHLVGGVYGVVLGAAFFGESMFHRARPRLPSGERHPLDGTDASKACLASLVEHLRRQGFTLFDAQLVNPHIARFGCINIDQDEYMSLLNEAVDLPVEWGEFQNSLPLDG